MSISKMIEQIMGDRLKKLGFNYEKSENLWLFIRKKSGTTEGIQIDKGKWQKKAFRLTYYKDGKSIDSFQFLGGAITQQWHYCEDQESAQKIIEKFLEITEQYGLHWFEENEAKYIKSDQNILNQDFTNELKIFIEEYKLYYSDLNCLSKIEQILEQNPTLENISLANRFFGEYIIHQLGAEWDFRPNNEIYLNHIGGIKNFNKGTFRIIDNYISDPNMHSINKSYLTIKNTVENIKSS